MYKADVIALQDCSYIGTEYGQIENASTRGFWSWIGKFAVLLGVILAAVRVYERFSKRVSALEAVEYNSEFKVAE